MIFRTVEIPLHQIGQYKQFCPMKADHDIFFSEELLDPISSQEYEDERRASLKKRVEHEIETDRKSFSQATISPNLALAFTQTQTIGKFSFKNDPKASMANSGGVNWTQALELKMLESVSSGQKWKEIAERTQFQEHGIDKNAIKRRFESDMRRKFRLLFKKAYRYTKQVHITDKTYKYLLSPKKVQQEVLMGKISEAQGNSIIKNFQFFGRPHWEGIQKNSRGRQSSEALLRKINTSTCITELVNAIITLQRALPQSQGFKLSKNCSRKIKLQEKRGFYEESEEEHSFFMNDRCLIPECFHNSAMQVQLESLDNQDQAVDPGESLCDAEVLSKDLIFNLNHQFEFRKDDLLPGATFE